MSSKQDTASAWEGMIPMLMVQSMQQQMLAQMAEAALNKHMDRMMMMTALERMLGGAGSGRAGLLSAFTGVSGKDTSPE